MGCLFGSSKARRTHAARQSAHQRGNGLNRIRRRLTIGCEIGGNLIHDRGPDHDAIGIGADQACMLGGLDAEADADRQVRVRLDALDSAGNTRGIQRREYVPGTSRPGPVTDSE